MSTYKAGDRLKVKTGNYTGKTGSVVKVDHDGLVTVKVDGNSHVNSFDPKSVTPVTRALSCNLQPLRF